jgi:hypothetical protein
MLQGVPSTVFFLENEKGLNTFLYENILLISDYKNALTGQIEEATSKLTSDIKRKRNKKNRKFPYQRTLPQ